MHTGEILSLIDNYHALLKYYCRVYKSVSIQGAKRIPLFNNDLPSLDNIKSAILTQLKDKVHPTDFIITLNRLYQISQSSSDLLALHSSILKQLYTDYPITKDIEELSFGIYEFLHNDIFETIDEFGESIIYKGFEEPMTDIPEYQFKDDPYILWKPYYLLQSVTEALLAQKRLDYNNQKEHLPKDYITEYIQKQQKKHLEQIIDLSKNLCNRNIIFTYLHTEDFIEKGYLSGCLFSDTLEKLTPDDYLKYIEIDYTKYLLLYSWHFERKTIKDYPELYVLPNFETLANLLATIFLFKEQINTTTPTKVAEVKPAHPNRKTAKLPSIEPVQQNTENSITDEFPSLGQYFELSPDEGIIPQPNKRLNPEYILDIVTLDSIYNQFNDELWHPVTLVEFMDIFTTSINKKENFRLKPRQTTRFYYLLKKIWLNKTDKTPFQTEKEWIIPFLKNYNLSYSAYTNQFIKNEGGIKHQQFIRSVDKLLPKDESK